MPRTANRSGTTAQQLRSLEDVLSTARRWARAEAMALLDIQEKELWHVTDFTSFEEYAVSKWNYDRSTIYRLTQWARVCRQLATENVPQRESTARPLYGLTDEQVKQSWKIATRRNPDPTALEVSEAVSITLRRQQPQKPAEDQQQVSGEIVRGDAVKMLGSLPDACIDLLFTSPPYAMQRHRDFPSVKESDFPAWMVSVMSAARPKMKPHGSIIINAREHVRNGQISDYLLRTRLALREAGWCEIDVLMWWKPDSPPLGRMDRPRRAYENLYWYSPSPSPWIDTRACGTDMVEGRERMARWRSEKSKHYGDPNFARFRGGGKARVTDVIRAPKGSTSAGVDHAAPFPLSLADQVVRTYSPAGGLVADCFAGSGTTLLAAKNAGRNWWGCDVVHKYVVTARKRLAR